MLKGGTRGKEQGRDMKPPWDRPKSQTLFLGGKWDIFRRLWGKAGTQRSKESAAEAWQAFTVTAEAPCCSVHAVWRLLQAEKCLSWEVCVCQRQRPTSMDGWLGAHRWGGGTTFRERLFYSPGELTCRCSSSCVTCFDSTAKNGSEKKTHSLLGSTSELYLGFSLRYPCMRLFDLIKGQWNKWATTFIFPATFYSRTRLII